MLIDVCWFSNPQTFTQNSKDLTVNYIGHGPTFADAIHLALVFKINLEIICGVQYVSTKEYWQMYVTGFTTFIIQKLFIGDKKMRFLFLLFN